ncbi:unnamed protein product [Pleuronectes platessa]|uniref:Uncharacterized protein n=1 Tax=Pleuronectes platessa TaxID=8262 RepID=A0A9N7YHH6_PLEPL|nr:unnamed protein product [Pleuronectes platessa]
MAECAACSVNPVHLWVADRLRLEIKALDEESSGLGLVHVGPSEQKRGIRVSFLWWTHKGITPYPPTSSSVGSSELSQSEGTNMQSMPQWFLLDKWDVLQGGWSMLTVMLRRGVMR